MTSSFVSVGVLLIPDHKCINIISNYKMRKSQNYCPILEVVNIGLFKDGNKHFGYINEKEAKLTHNLLSPF